jgi:creatinine amidohydrolase
MSFLFRDQSSPQLGEYLKKRTLLILPIGTTEEHGDHMPVDTDARIAEAYGTRLAEALVPEMSVLLMDTIRYGYSLKIMRQWPGTIIIRSRVFMDMIFDLCRSLLDMGFEKLVMLDCHGGHGGLLNTVSRELCDATDKAVAIIKPFVMARNEFNAARKSPAGGALHGCEFETSLVLHISPEVVDMSKATNVDFFRYHTDFVAGDNCLGSQKVTWSTWYLQPSKTGAYGDPTVATAEMGKLIMDAAVANGARFLKEYCSR